MASNFQISDSLLPLISRVYKEFIYGLNRSLQENNIQLSIEQLVVLKHLNEKDGYVQNDLAFITNRDKTSLTRLISKMEMNGLVKRLQCKHDNRCNKVYITPKGEDMFTLVKPILDEKLINMHAVLNAGELTQTKETLHKIINHLTQSDNECK